LEQLKIRILSLNTSPYIYPRKIYVTEFNPAKLSVLAATNTPALGQATRIMLLAMGFTKVEITPIKDICARAAELKPTFILFSPEYLTMPMQERLTCGCPCPKKDKCGKSLNVIFLKKKTIDSVLKAKDMGFDGIMFANQPMDRLYEALETVYTSNDLQKK